MGDMKSELLKRLQSMGISEAEFEAKIAENAAQAQSPKRRAAVEEAMEKHLQKAKRYLKVEV